MPRPKKGVIDQSITNDVIKSIEALPVMACINKKEVFNALVKLKIINISYHTYQHWQTEYNKYEEMNYEQYREAKNKEEIKIKQLTKNEWYFCELIPTLLFSPVSIMRQKHYETALQSESAKDKADWLKMYDFGAKQEDLKIKNMEFKTQIDNTVEAFNLLRQAENEIHKKTD